MNQRSTFSDALDEMDKIDTGGCAIEFGWELVSGLLEAVLGH